MLNIAHFPASRRNFVNFKSILALLHNKGHNLLTSIKNAPRTSSLHAGHYIQGSKMEQQNAEKERITSPPNEWQA